MPEEDICPSIPGALNAFAIAHDVKHGFIFSREKGVVVKQDLESGEMTDLSWKTKNYGLDRYLVYCLFQWKRLEDGLGPDKIGLLVFDLKYRKFRIPLLTVTGENQLKTIREFELDLPKIREEKLAYSAHRHAGKLEIIFYERYDKNFPTETLNFAYVAVDLSTGELRRPKTGVLPANGRWQLPFIAEMKLFFVSIDSTGTKIASLSANNVLQNQTFTVESLLATDSGELPSKRAIWCHAWECGTPWFIVSKPTSNPANMNNVQLWTINLRTRQWNKVCHSFQLRSDFSALAIRAPNSSSVYMYCDSTEAANNAFFTSFNVSEYVNSRRQDKGEKEDELDKPMTSTNYADIICPICLDTYSDPRTLFCGHSLCFPCLIRMREVSGTSGSDVKCPNCRKVTKIPSEGLPTNYGLQKAIDMIIKSQKIRESGFRCSDCKSPGLTDDFWVCLPCLKSMQIDLPESCEMLCASCVLRNHERHLTKRFVEYRTYCSSLLQLKDECNQKIQKTADQIGEDLKLLVQAEVVEKLVTSSKDIVESFISCRTIHEQGSLEGQEQEVNETLKNIAQRIKQEARPLFSQLLERAILSQAAAEPSTSPQISPNLSSSLTRFDASTCAGVVDRKTRPNLPPPRLTTSTSSDNELFERLIRIP